MLFRSRKQHRFPDARKDIQTSSEVPDTPQTRAPTFRLAFHDTDFLCRDELRPMRLQLELLKPEMALAELGIESTVVLFGGARIPDPVNKDSARTKSLADLSKYYTEARKFAALCTESCIKHGHKKYVVCTGGGPGVMEAGNRGAADVDRKSVV